MTTITPMTSNKKTTPDKSAEAVLVLVTFFWGCTFPIVKEAITSIPIFAFLAFRFGLAAILMTPFIKRSQMTPKTIKKGLILGILLFLSFAFQTFGLANTSASVCAFITGLSVVWVALLTEINRRTLLSVTLAVAGLWLLTDPTNAAFQIGWGEILTFICSLFIAWHIIILARLDDKAASAELAILQFIVTALLSLAASLGTEPRLLPETWDIQLIFAFAITTLGATIFAFWAQTHFQRRTTAMRASLIFIMEPLFAALFAVAFYGEQLAATAAVGGLLIVLAMAVSAGKKITLIHP